MQISFNDMLSSSAYIKQKEIVNREAQEPKFIPVNKDAFKKTDAEKALLLSLKAQLPKTRNYKFTTYSHFTT